MKLFPGEFTIREYILQMGDVNVSAGADILTCFGLGSCVGLFLYDRIHKVGGGAHIMLPYYHTQAAIQAKSYYAEYAIEELLRQMRVAGADVNRLRAKMIGGAKVIDARLMDIGICNTETTQAILNRHKIYIAAKDLGGSTSRTARFNIANGMVEITSQTNTYTI